LINRTLVYGALTVCVVAMYVLVVGYLGLLFQTTAGTVISLLATGIVAVLFQPLRERMQRAVNRLLYGQRDEPYAVLSRLGQRVPGEAFSTADRRLLDDLAHQAGVAVHAVALTAELQRSRERLVLAREEERRRLRRDLHDGLGPVLASMFQRLDSAVGLVERDPKAAGSLLSGLRDQVKITLGDLRRLVYALRPPALDEFGLVAAIRDQASQHETAEGLQVFVTAPETLPALPAAVEVAAFRIAAEALTNVSRHAHAHTCRISLDVSDVLILQITDDGTRMPNASRTGVDLSSMRERAAELGGSCRVDSSAGSGTHVCARLPIPKE